MGMKYWEIRMENPVAEKVAGFLERIRPELKPHAVIPDRNSRPFWPRFNEPCSPV
jgi:hypothetical protein